jgi:hypothetical protein
VSKQRPLREEEAQWIVPRRQNKEQCPFSYHLEGSPDRERMTRARQMPQSKQKCRRLRIAQRAAFCCRSGEGLGGRVVALTRSVDFGAYLGSFVEEVRERLTDQGAEIEISSHLQSVALDLEAAVFLSIAVTELLESAVEHAKHEGPPGKIGVHFWAVGNPELAYALVAHTGGLAGGSGCSAQHVKLAQEMASLARTEMICSPGEIVLWQIKIARPVLIRVTSLERPTAGSNHPLTRPAAF